MTRSSGRAAAVAADHGRAARKATARPGRTSAAPLQPQVPERTVASVAAPAFHERSLFAEGLAAAFRIEVGGGAASGSLPWGAGENEIAKFLSEAISLAKQMQTAMGGHDGTAVLQILVADQEAGASRQSAIKVSVESSGGTVVTLQPGGGGHLVAMLQHFLMALSPASRDAA